MILVWFDCSRGDEFDSGNNFQVEKNFCKAILTDKERYTKKRNRDVRIVSQYRVGWWVIKN